jgi:hypothetical protein
MSATHNSAGATAGAQALPLLTKGGLRASKAAGRAQRRQGPETAKPGLANLERSDAANPTSVVKRLPVHAHIQPVAGAQQSWISGSGSLLAMRGSR